MLIGAGIDQLGLRRRAVLNPWNTQELYVNYTQDDLLTNKAREVFDICYLPSLLLG
jgi:hypothetical protein